jgi:hypothetical protein
MADSTIDSSVVAGGTIDGTDFVEVTVDGDVVWVAISTLMEIFSGTAYNGQKVEFSLSGNSGASSLTFTGNRKTNTRTKQKSTTTESISDSFTVNGNASPTNENIELTGSSEVQSEFIYGELGAGGSTSVTINADGNITNQKFTSLHYDYASIEDYNPSFPYISDGESATVTVDTSNINEYSKILLTGQDGYASDVDFYVDGEYIGNGSVDGNGNCKVYGFKPKNAGSQSELKVVCNDSSESIVLKSDDNSQHVEFILESTGVMNIGSEQFNYEETKNVLFSDGDTIQIDTDWEGPGAYKIEWEEEYQCKNISISVGSSTIDLSTLNGTHTESVNLSTGDDTISGSYTDGNLSYDLSWTENTDTEDPSLIINGTTFTHNGVLSAGSTKSFTPSESLFGETTDVLDLALTDGEVDVNFDLEIQDQNSVTIDTLPNNWSSNFSDL